MIYKKEGLAFYWNVNNRYIVECKLEIIPNKN
jgi:hypothetical protein